MELWKHLMYLQILLINTNSQDLDGIDLFNELKILGEPFNEKKISVLMCIVYFLFLLKSLFCGIY